MIGRDRVIRRNEMHISGGDYSGSFEDVGSWE
jgi:hypothetical protein